MSPPLCELNALYNRHDGHYAASFCKRKSDKKTRRGGTFGLHFLPTHSKRSKSLRRGLFMRLLWPQASTMVFRCAFFLREHRSARRENAGYSKMHHAVLKALGISQSVVRVPGLPVGNDVRMILLFRAQRQKTYVPLTCMSFARCDINGLTKTSFSSMQCLARTPSPESFVRL
ncbi:hypothetical protein FKP32DRAFT_1080346 [Trametes sanguinea]|nr:hypothetical protein FKP32DRAFT_1080346 [Trametes sanguinea]